MYSMFMANDVSVVEFRLSLEFDCRVRRLIASINKTVFLCQLSTHPPTVSRLL